jgi:hypothetical protein
MNSPSLFRITNAGLPLYLAKAPGGSGVWLGISPEDFDAPGFVSVFEREDVEATEAADLRGFEGRWVAVDSAS